MGLASLLVIRMCSPGNEGGVGAEFCVCSRIAARCCADIAHAIVRCQLIPIYFGANISIVDWCLNVAHQHLLTVEGFEFSKKQVDTAM